MRRDVSVKDFEGVIGNGLNDDTAGLALARDYLAANATRCKLVFPSGIYVYSESPNWAIDNAVIDAEGEVRLRYTGAGNAVIIDAGAGNVYNMETGRFIVEAPATSLAGVYVCGIHHSRLSFNVRGAGASGLDVRFAVCTVFDRPTVSVNEAGWYLGAKPLVGMILRARNPGETVSYCSFNNPIIEGPPSGVQLVGTLGNSFFGGTIEGCADMGLYAGVGANHDVFWKTDFEANGIDAYLMGNNIALQQCESDNYVAVGSAARRCSIIGGEYRRVLFDLGSCGCVAAFLKYDRFNDGGTFVDAGTDNAIHSVKSAATNRSHLTGSIAFARVVGIPEDGATFATVAVPGAAMGDPVLASLSPMTGGFMVSAYVSSSELVTVQFVNKTGGVATLAAGTLKAIALRP